MSPSHADQAPVVAPRFHVEPATPERWEDVTKVFGTRGDASVCWCQWFTLNRLPLRRENADLNKAGLERRVCQADGPPAGVLAYVDDVPVGWLRVGPVRELPRMLTSKAAGSALRPHAGDWMASCFVVRVGHRRRGVSKALLEGGVELARACGAPGILGHPLDIAALAGRRPAAADLYTGTLNIYLKAGFTEIARTLPHRALVRLEFAPAR